MYMAFYMWVEVCAICVLPNRFITVLVFTQLFGILHYLPQFDTVRLCTIVQKKE